MLDLGTNLLHTAQRVPDELAIVDGDRRYRYAEWIALVADVAASIEQLGLAVGDRVLCVLQNRWEAMALYWACQLGGFVFVPINWRATAEELQLLLLDSGARLIVFEAISAEAVATCPAAARLPRVLATDGEADGAIRFGDLLGAGAAPVARAAPDDLSVLLYTSGTTGRPKGVPRRHRTERASALLQIAINILRRGEVALGCMPIYHTMGIRALNCAALLDGRFVCQPRFDAGQALALIERERVTHLALVPTLYHDLVEHPDMGGRDLSSVRKLMFAGAPMVEGLLRRLERGFAPELIVNQYGSTEIYVFTFDQRAQAKPGSAGKGSLHSVARVIGLDSGDPDAIVAPGVEGQIIVSLGGDDAFEGYWNRPDADAMALREGWYFTNDTGWLNADGDLFVTGRVDDMIISGGENISPVEIESKLSLHPAVREAVVFGTPDDRLGQAVTAAIRSNAKVPPDELDRFCRETGLPGYKCPKRYIFVDHVPRSPSGKILRRLLVARCAGA